MTILGIADATVASLVRPLTDPAHDRDAVAERFARATWTAIAEPGDGIAGLVVASVGAEAALAALIDDREGGLLRHALEEAGVGLDADELTQAVARWEPRISKADALLALRQGARFGVALVVPGDPDWPTGLADLGHFAPLALWMRGSRERLSALDRGVAIVGARAATGYGEHVTIELASGLVDRGFAIVSGAAYGIDGAAHRAALASRGSTVAVLAGGLDRFYPSGHEQLLTRIVDRGVVLSEVPPGTTPTKWRFLLRNRLIAALADAVVAVEAGWRSGSLNTAGHAGTLGRPLGAVPGPVTSAASSGCHRLLREYAAVCVTTADEAAELAGVTPRPSAQPHHAADLSGTRVRVLDAVHERTPRRVERIAALSGLAADRVRAELGLLELEGFVLERPSGWTRRKEA